MRREEEAAEERGASFRLRPLRRPKTASRDFSSSAEEDEEEEAEGEGDGGWVPLRRSLKVVLANSSSRSIRRC